VSCIKIKSNKMKSFITIISVLTFLPLFIYSFTLNSLGNDGSEATPDVVSVSGESLFQKNCAACHGNNLQGNPPAFPSLVSIEKRKSREQVEDLLKTGGKVMPSFAHLSETERKAISGFLFGISTESEVVTDLPPDENGRNLVVANCVRCHRLTPDDPQPPGQKRWGMQPAVLGGITGKYEFSDFEYVLNSGPCYMPSFASLGTADKEDIYTYLQTMEGSRAAVYSGYRMRGDHRCGHRRDFRNRCR